MAEPFDTSASVSVSASNVEIAMPALGPAERAAVLEVLEGRELVKGRRVAAFEQAFAAYHGAPHAVATSSGATALTTMLLAHGIGPGDEVVVPSFSFFATAACVLGVGATPVFADIEADSFCLSVSAAEAAITPRTRAIMPVHLYGMPADMGGFLELCARHRLLLLEDAAQAHGASFEGRPVGTFGTAAFSFYATKNLSTLEGGMVLTADPDVARRVRLFRNHGREGGGPHEVLGTNARMTEVAAAIGLVQLERLPGFTAARRENASYFDAALRSVVPPARLARRAHVYHQYTVRVRPGTDRDAFVRALNLRGIGARVYYPRPIHAEPALRGLPARVLALPETERACREVVSLPVHPGVTPADRERVVAAVND